MQRHPVKVAPGFVSEAENCRFYENDIAPRRGLGILTHANSFATPWPLVFPINFFVPAGLGTVHGVGLFSDPAGTEWLLFAGEDVVWITRDGFPLETLALPEGETIEHPCFFQQAGDVLYLLRGRETPILAWRRELLAELPWVSGWELLDTSDHDDGTHVIPRAESAILKADRLLLPYGRDGFVASDALDFERYQGAAATYSLDTGQAERLLRLMPFGEQTVVAFKNPKGIYQITGVTGDLAGMSRADNPIATEIGLAAFWSAVAVGADIFFLSHGGVTSIRQVLDNRLQGKADVLSEPITPLIERINWQAVAGAVAEFWGRCYYLAVPLDEGATNNAVLVYDVEHRAWAGVDTLAVKYFVKAQHHGRQRLLAVDYDGLVRVVEEHFEDETVGGWEGVGSDVLTRGYVCGSPDEKVFRRVGLDVETWNPNYSIGVQ